MIFRRDRLRSVFEASNAAVQHSRISGAFGTPETPVRKEIRMQERKIRMDIRVTGKEKDMIRQKAQNAGISQSAFVRQAISKVFVNPAANEDVMVLLREIRIVKRHLSEILAKTEARNAIDFVQANRAIRSAEEAIDRINRAYTPGG